jgi:hypothetical protein
MRRIHSSPQHIGDEEWRLVFDAFVDLGSGPASGEVGLRGSRAQLDGPKNRLRSHYLGH